MRHKASRRVDESVPSQQGLKHRSRTDPVAYGPVDESVPSQQGLKQELAGERHKEAIVLSMSPFHHNKD